MKMFVLSFIAGCFCCVGVGQEVPPVPMPASPVDNIVIDVETILENEGCSSCRRTPVRNLVSGALSVPGRVVDRWQEVQPIRRVASIPVRVADRWMEVQPVRRVFRRTACFTRRAVRNTACGVKRTLMWGRNATRRVLYY